MKVAGALVNPNGITNHSYYPYLVKNAVLSIESSDTLHYQYPDRKSKDVKYLAPCN